MPIKNKKLYKNQFTPISKDKLQNEIKRKNKKENLT